jgi:hypothetical protein
MDVAVPTKWMPIAPPEPAALTTTSAVALWFKDPFVPLVVSVDPDAGSDCACGVDTSKLSVTAANIIFVFIAIDEMLDGFLVNDG